MKLILYTWKIFSVLVSSMRSVDKDQRLARESIIYVNSGFLVTVVISLFSSMAPSIFLFNIVNLNYYWLIETNLQFL